MDNVLVQIFGRFLQDVSRCDAMGFPAVLAHPTVDTKIVVSDRGSGVRGGRCSAMLLSHNLGLVSAHWKIL